MARLQEIFTKNLRNLRRKSGLTQAELAEKVNVSTHHIGMIEMSRNYPTLELVERIANALNIEIHELFIDNIHSNNELARLRQEIRGDMEQLFEKFLERILTGKFGEEKTEIRVTGSSLEKPNITVKSVKSGIPKKPKKS
ncbi:MAG: helix-turn-helix domain-containing protein [Treponema sp.]|jgi:transcriptional regulator with XRE-family HTH domain|nr:helix-turn-helix domain-containing protein [Treponema sp.]